MAIRHLFIRRNRRTDCHNQSADWFRDDVEAEETIELAENPYITVSVPPPLFLEILNINNKLLTNENNADILVIKGGAL